MAPCQSMQVHLAQEEKGRSDLILSGVYISNTIVVQFR